MMDPVAEWHKEHVRFAQLLDLLEKQVAMFHAGDQPNYDLMRDIIRYLRHFADHFHHPREDVAFARLAERDASMRAPVNRLMQEHRVIAHAGEELLGYLNDIEADVMIDRATVEAAAATYLVYYRHHLEREEAEVVPRAAQLLTQADWAAVAAAVSSGSDPLFRDEFEERYRELREQIMREARQS